MNAPTESLSDPRDELEGTLLKYDLFLDYLDRINKGELSVQQSIKQVSGIRRAHINIFGGG